ELEKEGKFELDVDGKSIQITIEDVEIISEDIPGWLVTNDGQLTVALDVTVTDELKEEGIAREFINRIQNLRKESGFNVTDKIHVQIQKQVSINTAIEKYADHIGLQTLALSVVLVENLIDDKAIHLEFDETKILISIKKA
ncbi:MAG: isoleucine--tRNA ligase, partial [Bacteroidales bacterium]|nr:isoleucine--tRNA ligase [Bacteroidales bacterium]